MQLIFEKSKEGRGCDILPKMDVIKQEFPKEHRRSAVPKLPQMAEVDISRHYTELAKCTHGVNDGFYPLGSCTMKYNPRINEETAGLKGFTQLHPLQPEHTVQGALEVLTLAEKYLCEITGMDAMTFQPSAGAHGEFTGLLLIRAYHKHRGELEKRRKIIVPDAAHGTNPASAVMAGFTVVNIPSDEQGFVDIEELKEVCGEDTAGLMLTNPNTLGIFEQNILAITEIVHQAGGLVYYDGANLNAIMGIARPGDMGFDVVHLNLHKTFSTPHGGGGPGSGPVGCKERLMPFLPQPAIVKTGDKCQPLGWDHHVSSSIGAVRSFPGNFLVVVKALTYIMSLGGSGIREAAQNAVLNANYMMHALSDLYPMAVERTCMHEFVMTLEQSKKEKDVSALDIAKALLDYGVHPPTMYFPLIVHEALMVEPTETESKDTLDEAIRILREIYETGRNHPDEMHQKPLHTPVRRLDEVNAARHPKLRF
ncbi:aminomethyl-transferring glycine dehydrogenase subunit GcvPB [Sinanaerobacter sp. ZZT-01]|uniref:aminomethyl-transferring glycine dehydrogenase subunit GcvPB n=1 Tax=Sinanaerobacter sp. ZZT-01 TaxID=3111540 RepID=UPI002D7999C0|nr:aminomethyl-transferring glycine dehydrogenase subunit GcvPB [Sinanaerobacter sp. ZZT-01]WRR94413.1 aminomethyl-transferring glycine dehydrogenase subunit GcvPB [Sinanaerobacter sp. ZZT-01]